MRTARVVAVWAELVAALVVALLGLTVIVYGAIRLAEYITWVQEVTS